MHKVVRSHIKGNNQKRSGCEIYKWRNTTIKNTVMSHTESVDKQWNNYKSIQQYSNALTSHTESMDETRLPTIALNFCPVYRQRHHMIWKDQTETCLNQGGWMIMKMMKLKS